MLQYNTTYTTRLLSVCRLATSGTVVVVECACVTDTHKQTTFIFMFRQEFYQLRFFMIHLIQSYLYPRRTKQNVPFFIHSFCFVQAIKIGKLFSFLERYRYFR